MKAGAMSSAGSFDRAFRFGRELGLHDPFLFKLVPAVDDCLGEAFPEIKARKDYVSTVIESEEASFGRTLDRGLEIFTDAADKAKNKTISGDAAFQLYDTYGFPVDLTQLMAQERGLKVDTAGFDKLMEQQRCRARAAQKVAQAIVMAPTRNYRNAGPFTNIKQTNARVVVLRYHRLRQ